MILTVSLLALAALSVISAPTGLSSPLVGTVVPAPRSSSTMPSSFASYSSPISGPTSGLTSAHFSSPSAAFSQATATLKSTSTSFFTMFRTVTMTTTVLVRPTTTTIVEPSTVTTTVTPSPTPAWSNRTAWAAPPKMTDLTAFNVTYFPSGQRNLLVVDGIPVEAGASRNASSTQISSANTASALRLLYPANSINPARKPAGGAEFYAMPLNLSGARNVTLEYSVFFPVDFIWVKAGKLPGLYGGHTGCSGGAAARTCFSTRLMWRPHGVGELYLYAPKDKQTAALCSDPQSVCDAAYGLSIGRGSFSYTPGEWTTLRQNVVLNTPGQQDGVFTLDVNGKQVINRTDIFYRDVPEQQKSTKPKPSPSSGLLGPLLGLLGRAPPATPTPGSILEQNRTVTMVQTLFRTEAPVTQTVGGGTVIAHVYPTVSPETVAVLKDSEDSPEGRPVGFTGLFFSTFFGGHEEDYATPKDQYTWFTNFSINRHW